jgi:hypothetical protein
VPPTPAPTPADPTTPPPTPPDPTTPPPTPPDPTTPPPTPPDPTTPPPLAFSTPTFTPTELGRGTLTVSIAERGAPVAPAAPSQEAPAPLRVELTLSSGARAFPEAPQDPRCTPPPTPAPGEGQVVTCTLEQPATGADTTFEFDLQVDGPGQTADMVLFRGDTEEARFVEPLLLETYGSGLSVVYSAGPWTIDGPGTGTLNVRVAQAAGWDVVGATITIGVTGGAQLDPARPTPGCTQEATGNPGITCALPTIPAGGTVDLAVHLAINGDGQKAQSLALSLGGTEVARLDQPVDLRRDGVEGDGGDGAAGGQP